MITTHRAQAVRYELAGETFDLTPALTDASVTVIESDGLVEAKGAVYHESEADQRRLAAAWADDVRVRFSLDVLDRTLVVESFPMVARGPSYEVRLSETVASAAWSAR